MFKFDMSFIQNLSFFQKSLVTKKRWLEFHFINKFVASMFLFTISLIDYNSTYDDTLQMQVLLRTIFSSPKLVY